MTREPSPPLFSAHGLACGRGGKVIIDQVDFALAAGEILFLLGPNGAGKTTLLQTLLRRLKPLAGEMFLSGENVADWPPARFARVAAYVPQSHKPPFPFTVFDVVLMGRSACHGAFSSPSRVDRECAEEALETLGVSRLRDRPVTEISGGERQLVLFARALAQRPRLLILDEPTASLDFGNQIAVLGHARARAKRNGLGIILAAHDPNQALAHADRVALIGGDGGFSVGAPETMITADWLEKTYAVKTRIVRSNRQGEPAFCVPVSRSREEDGPCAV